MRGGRQPTPYIGPGEAVAPLPGGRDLAARLPGGRGLSAKKRRKKLQIGPWGRSPGCGAGGPPRPPDSGAAGTWPPGSRAAGAYPQKKDDKKLQTGLWGRPPGSQAAGPQPYIRCWQPLTPI